MPAATATKSASSGTKRKVAPVKNVQVKESKKAKIDSGRSKAPVVKRKPAVKEREASDSSDSESESDSGSDSDGGVRVRGESSEDVEENGNSESTAKAGDTIHPERAKLTNGTSSRESHAKQKQLAQERKAAKPLADPLQRTKKLWERLRRKSHVPKDERDKLVTELFEIITGQIKDFVLKHDSVRVVQTAIKYANPAQRRMIANELKGAYRQLAESRYAKFLIGKLLVQGDDEIRDLIVPEFYGHVRKLIKHPEASWILDDVYRGVATKRQKAIILREWYGTEFAIFQTDNDEEVTGDLSQILAKEPGKRAPIMRSLHELINHLVQKKMTGFTLLHDAMLQYFLNAKPGTEEVTEFLELLKGDEEGDLMKNLAFTKSGARVVSHALAYGNAKDRKMLLKSYKDTLQMMAGDSNGHLIILAAYEVIDDTVLTSKSIFPELLSKDADKQVENIVFSANDLIARTTLLYLFQGRSKALFPPSLTTDLDVLAEVDTIRSTTSKKDPEVRLKELAKSLSPFLLKGIASAAPNLVATTFGCQFITEVLFGAEGDKSVALEAVAAVAVGDPTYVQSEQDGVESSDPPSHIASTPFGGKMIKSLIAGGRFDSKTKKTVPVEPALDFADILYPHIKDHIIEWATGSSSFVVLALLESPSFSQKEEVLQILKDNKKVLKKAATEETAEQSASRQAAEATDKDNDKRKKPKGGKKERTIGNKGSALLLEKL